MIADRDGLHRFATSAFAATLALATLLACGTTPLNAATPAAESDAEIDAEFAKSLDTLLSGHRGKVSAAVKHLPSGETYLYEADRPMPTASLIKLPVMAAAYRAAAAGKLDLDQSVTLNEEDKVPGSGILTNHFSAGTKMPLVDAIRLMIAYSDNTATNLVVDQIGLPATGEFMQELGYPNTRIYAKVYRRDTSIDMERSKQFGLGSTTAKEMLSLIESLWNEELISAEASRAMREHLLACKDTSKIPRYLPSDVSVAHKTGSVSSVRCDAGVIDSSAGPIAFCILTDENEDRSWGNENEAELLAAEFGRAVYSHYVKPEDANVPAAARVLKSGDGGLLVEALQRTLNARVKPSLDIGVDGDFGPNTEAAVIKFQKQAGVEPTGEVGAETWRALGPLMTEDQPVVAPQEVNSAPLARDAADPLSGPPFVTCKAYAIADAKTGKVLWGYQDSLQRDPASVTKIMTAYLVTSLAEQDPSVLEETITFTKTADDTVGSTSGVRVGEQVRVSDAIYGLMLPSGNDMSVAIAEHFGPRFSSSSDDSSAYESFIAEMNRRAQTLGMHSTTYRNTHGLTASDHTTTAADMVKLAHAALSQPLFREVVNTPKWGCTLNSIDGYQRNVVWRNTNRLLRIDGYYGVKTGTTGPAGACLVSAGKKGDADLIIVVLGSSCSDARYADTRNLYRWAWRQLAAE